MLQWALAFFIVVLVAAFSGVGGIAASIVKILFFAFLVMALVSLVFGLVDRRAA